MFINKEPSNIGNYGNPRSSGGGYILPDGLIDDYLSTKGFATITLDGENVTAVELNEEAYNAYISENPDVPLVKEPTTEELLDILLGGDIDD